MKRLCSYISLLALPCLICGCPPEKRIVWSHDGKRAAVAADDALYFIDADGAVLAPRLDAQTMHCTWFNDNQRLLVVRIKPAHSWEEVSTLFSDDQKRIIAEEAAALKKSVMAYEGNWDKFDISFKDKYSSGTTAAILLYLRDKLGEGLQSKLAEKYNDIKQMKLDVNILQIYELSETGLTPGKVLARSPDGIGGVSLSRMQDKVAYVTHNGAKVDDRLTLFTQALTGGDPISIATNVGGTCAWSPDDRQLAYFKCMTGDSANMDTLQLGVLTFATVADQTGRLVSEADTEQEQIGVLFNALWSIHWLSDGRVLFSSLEVTLPATNADMPQRWGLFIFDPRMPSTVTRVFGRGMNQSLEESFPHFELSPDEQRVLMLGNQGEVVSYELSSGKSQVLSTDPCTGNGGSPQMIPVWRTNGEACYDVCVGEGTGPDQKRQVVIWKDGKTHVLSENWPEAMKADWLNKKRSISTEAKQE